MTSQIDSTIPVYGNPTTQSVRANFTTASQEISALQAATAGSPFLPLAGGTLTGALYLRNDPTDVMMPATKGYVDAHSGTGGGGIPEAPADGKAYGRDAGAWVPVLPLAGGTLTGALILAADPTAALGAATKQYADVGRTLAQTAVQRAGDTMTGLLVLSGPPTAALGACTKGYTDSAVAPLAPIANPIFTGLVTATNAGRFIASGTATPSLTLNNTTAGSPVFGLWNSGSVLGVGLAVAASGNPSGNPLAQMDQSGNWSFLGRVNATGGRLLSTSNSNPSLTLNNTGTGNPPIFSLWNNGSLQFGIADATGAPQSSIASMDNTGNLYLHGATIPSPAPAAALVMAPVAMWTSSGAAGNGMLANTYYDGTNFRYRTAGAGGYLNVGNDGVHSWVAFPSGAAGAVATLTTTMVLDAAGNLTPTGAVAANNGLFCGNSAAPSHAFSVYTGSASPNGALFYWGGSATAQGGTVVGSISTTASSTAYNTTSDARLKTDIEPISRAFCNDVLARLEPIHFRWADPGDTPPEGFGFIAQDTDAVFPQAVTRGRGAPGGDDFIPWMMDHSKLVPLLVRAIQQLTERLEAVESRL